MSSPVVSIATESPASEEGSSHTVKVQQRVREMILAGVLPAGLRITELGMVERLGVSRTPIRTALIRLEQEGLLQMLPSGGYVVRTFSEEDVAVAIDLRGTMEGMVARRVAERGVDAASLAQAREILQAIDALLERSEFGDVAFEQYAHLNQQFHECLRSWSPSPMLCRELERVCSMPFASPSGFVNLHVNSPRARDMLLVAHTQHWQVLEAIAAREGARAEAILREHSRIALSNVRLALAQSQTHLPGVGLIKTG